MLLTWAASSAASGAARVAGAATEAVGAATGQAAGQAATAIGDPTGYFSDMLLRSDHPAQGDQAAATAIPSRVAPAVVYWPVLLKERSNRRGWADASFHLIFPIINF